MELFWTQLSFFRPYGLPVRQRYLREYSSKTSF